MNGRKRNDYYKRESEKNKRNSERSELRPPNTYTLPSLLTLLNSISPTSLNFIKNTILCSTQLTLQNTILSTFRLTLIQTLTYTSLCTIHTTHNITTNRLVFLLCSSLSTDSFLDAEHIIPFTSIVGNDSFVNVKNSGTCSIDLTLNTVIIVYRLDVVNTIQFNIGLIAKHLLESAAQLIAET